MKLTGKQNSSKEPTIKHEFDKLNLLHLKKRQNKSDILRFAQKQLGQFDFSKKNDRDRKKADSAFPLTSPFVINQTERLNKNLSRTWWIHLWSGLVLDKEAKHQKQMKQAVWLYLYLLLVANWKTGILYRRVSTIIRETGFNRRSIQRWLKLLREKQYIKTQSTGRSLHISITKWKPILRRKKSESWIEFLFPRNRQSKNVLPPRKTIE